MTTTTETRQAAAARNVLTLLETTRDRNHRDKPNVHVVVTHIGANCNRSAKFYIVDADGKLTNVGHDMALLLDLKFDKRHGGYKVGDAFSVWYQLARLLGFDPYDASVGEL